jgi:hypothetical protein
LVDADRVKRKLPSLLVDEPTIKKNSCNSLMRYRYHYSRFKKKNPERYNALMNKIITDLAELEETVNL